MLLYSRYCMEQYNIYLYGYVAKLKYKPYLSTWCIQWINRFRSCGPFAFIFIPFGELWLEKMFWRNSSEYLWRYSRMFPCMQYSNIKEIWKFNQSDYGIEIIFTANYSYIYRYIWTSNKLTSDIIPSPTFAVIPCKFTIFSW